MYMILQNMTIFDKGSEKMEEVIEQGKEELQKILNEGGKIIDTIIHEKDKVTTKRKIELANGQSTSSTIIQNKEDIKISFL